MPVFFTTPTFARQGVVASFVLTPPGLDLVFNPFFESGIGWTWVNSFLDTSFYETTIDFCHSSIRLNLNPPTAYVSETTPHPVTPGQVYEVAVDVFSTGWPGEQNVPPTTAPASWTNLLVVGPHEPTGTMELQCQFWSSVGGLISTSTVATSSPTGGLWATIGGSVTVPGGAAGMTILIVLSGETEQDWWLDNVQLELSQSAFVPDISIGVLFAQGTIYAPTLPPTLPAAPAPTGGALSLQSWLFYNSSSGFYWAASNAPTVSDDAFLGWVVTSATGIVAYSSRRLGTGLPEVITPIGPVTLTVAPPAPNVASATATVAAVTVGTTAYYQFSGTFVNAGDTTNVGQVAVVMENITGAPFDVPIDVFGAPLVAGATVSWVSALIPTPSSGGTLTFKPAFRSSNLLGAVTVPEVNTANLTVAAVTPPSGAPNVTAATAAVNYGLYGNASAYGFSGTVTLPTSDPAYPLLAGIRVMWVRGSDSTELQELNAPFGSSPAPWNSGLNLTFLQDASAHSDSIEFVCIDVNGLATATPLSVAVTVEASAVTSISSPAEIGPQVADANTRLVSTTVSFVPVLGSNQVPQNVTFLVSQDNGATWVYTGWSLISTVGQAITVSKISPLTTATWKVAACIGAVGGDPTIFMPASALAAAFPGVVISAGFSVAGLAVPAATAVTGASVGAFTNEIRADGTQYGQIGTCTYTDPTDLSFFVRVTVQQYGTGGALAPEQPFSGFQIAGAGGTVRTTGVLQITYVAGLTFIRYRIYLSSRTSSNTYDFLLVSGAPGTPPVLAVLQTCWAGSADHFDVAVTLPTAWGAGITVDATTLLPKINLGSGTTTDPSGRLAATVSSQSVLLDGDFELTAAGVTSATTISAWAFSNAPTIEADGTQYSGAQYLRFNSLTEGVAQQGFAVRAGESLYLSGYIRNATSGKDAICLLQFLNASGYMGGSFDQSITTSAALTSWTFVEGVFVVPTGAQQCLFSLIQVGAMAGTTDFDTVRVSAVARAKSLHLTGPLKDDGSGNTTVGMGAGTTLDGSSNVTLNLGAGTAFSGSQLEAALGAGTAFDGSNNITLHLGNGVQFSSGLLAANLTGPMTTSGGAITINVSAGIQISGASLAANVTGALSTVGGPISVLAGNGLQIASGQVQPNFGAGVTVVSSQLTLNLSSGLTFSGSSLVANVGGGLGFSGIQITISAGGVGPTQISSVNAAQVNAGTITVGSGGMTFSGTGGITIAGSGTFNQLVGAASSQSFTATGLASFGVRAFYLASAGSNVIDTAANGNFATLSVQGSTRIDASGNVYTNACNVFGSLNFAGSLSGSASAGSATLPSNPVGFVFIQVGGTAFKMPYYNV